jgi:hypothetical protein
VLSEGLNGERGRNRTFNLLIKSQLLCQLSYAPLLWNQSDEEHHRKQYQCNTELLPQAAAGGPVFWAFLGKTFIVKLLPAAVP